jgi:hypothetical protein
VRSHFIRVFLDKVKGGRGDTSRRRTPVRRRNDGRPHDPRYMPVSVHVASMQQRCAIDVPHAPAGENSAETMD